MSAVPNVSLEHTCGWVVLSLNATEYAFEFVIFNDLHVARDSGPMKIVKEKDMVSIQSVLYLESTACCRGRLQHAIFDHRTQ